MSPQRPAAPGSRLSVALALTVLFALAAAATAHAQASPHGDAAGAIEHDYVGAAKCKSCHKKELMGNQYQTWLEGPHHRAFETLKSDASLAIAQQQGLTSPPSEAPECLVCHVSAYGVVPARIMNALAPADGVQCESCHGPGRDFRKKKIMSDRDVAEENGLWNPQEDPGICLRCHNDASPTYDRVRYTLPDGSTSDFDYEQAAAAIPHPIPADTKGRFIELEKKERAAEKARKKAAGK